jgi:hypothetical chaperone protein
MTQPVAYGIDFGTSNSAISVAYPDEAVLVPLGPDDADVLPSVVYLDRTRQRLAGHQAVQQYLVAGSLRGTRLMSSIKSFLADPTWLGTNAPWGTDITPEELVAIVIGDLKRQADRYCGYDVKRAVLGHPVMFAGAMGDDWHTMQKLAIARLDRAARLAGFDEITFADEASASVAAEYGQEGILVGLDFGGGTFDVTVVRMTPNGRELLATHGAAIGGERFDSLLFDGLLAAPLGLTAEYDFNGKSLQVPRQIRQMGTLHGVLSMVGDDRTRKILDNFRAAGGGDRLRTVDEILYGGHGYNFFRTVEGAKIDLSSHSKADVRFVRPGIDVDHRITQAEFSKLISPDLDRIDGTIDKTLADAGVGPSDVHAVVRTGGSSQIPAFVDRVNRRFGPAKVEERDALATVALGLGLIALETFG